MDELMSQDADDLRAARQGGPEGQRAMARLYDRHAPVVHAVCRQHLGPPGGGGGASDDALQETFIRAYRMLDRLDSPDRLRPWLYGIARLVCSEMRRAAGRRRRHEGAAAMNHAPPAARDAEAPHESVSRAESLERLGEAIDRLPEQERLAVHLFYLDPDPVRAAKEALGLSRSGFYKLLARARDHLALSMREVRA